MKNTSPSIKSVQKSDSTTLFMDKMFFSKDKKSLLISLEDKIIRTKKPLVIFTPNPEQMVLAAENPEFSHNLSQADILLPDGVGIVLASQLLGRLHGRKALTHRIAGVDVVAELLRLSSQKSWPVLVLGGRGYTQRQLAAEKLAEITVSGIAQKTHLTLHWLEGYKNVTKATVQEEKQVRQALQQIQPKLVFVAFGAPWQEQWVIEHRDLLEKNGVKLVMVVGGAFDMLLGKVARAPFLVRVLGLEWFFRLIQEPWRWKRQLRLFRFMDMVGQELFKKRSS